MASCVSSLAEIIRQIPGYDPYAQSEGCWFDEETARKAIEFFPECLRHVEGAVAGQSFELEPWQQAVVANLFGWKRADGSRRYRESLIFVPRKNGKTPLVAGIGLYVLFCDPEVGQQNYIAAGEREQAGALFRQAKGMVEQEPELRARCKIYGGNAAAGQSRSIVRQDRNSFMRVISSDGDTKHGGTTHLAIIDELHVQPSRDLVDVLATSMASANRKQPLFIHITTAGHNRQSICYEKYVQACRVRDNHGDKNKPGYDPSFLPVVYETKTDEDWTSEAIWYKANPNLGVSVSLDYMHRECQLAQEIPDKENTFRQLHLNQWTQQAQRWLSMAKWDACGAESIDIESLHGRDCFAGLDLASTSDITAFVLVFPDPDGGFTILPRFWLPEAAVRKRSRADGVRYDTWVAAGLIRQTSGDWCDYTALEADIRADAERFNIRQVNYDPKEASMLSQKLLEAGVAMTPFVQSFANYNESVKLFEQLIGEKRLRHGGNQVLQWMADNVALDRNVAQLRMPSKKRSQDKIDGIVASIMGLAGAMMSDSGESVYNTRGLITL